MSPRFEKRPAKTAERRSNSGTAESKDAAGSDRGDGQYDFGETSLRQNKAKEAAAIMELNLEVNTPPSSWALSLAGMAQVANSEKDKAIADYKQILQQNPQDRFAKTQLDNLLNSHP